jgi:hypothetical protein
MPDVQYFGARLTDCENDHKGLEDNFERPVLAAFILAMRFGSEEIAPGDDFLRHLESSIRREPVIATNGRKRVERFIRKLDHLGRLTWTKWYQAFFRGFGRGNSLSVPQNATHDATHAATRAPSTDCPAAICARPRSTAAANVSSSGGAFTWSSATFMYRAFGHVGIIQG